MQTLQQCENIDLSVIIPVYNLERWIRPMLMSLQSQKIENYKVEIIFVDNNCTDNTVGIIRESGLECQVLCCAKQGCGPARNVGFEASCGEYIWFMDGDDWLLSDRALADVLDRAYADDMDILRIPYETDRFNMQYYSMVWQYLFRRAYIEDIRFPDFQPCEDDYFMDKVFEKAGYAWNTFLEMPSMDRPLYFYQYLREGSNMYRDIVLREKI